MSDYGERIGGAGKKGEGFFGPLPNKQGGISTELSVQFDGFNGGAPIPLLVPTLSGSDLNHILSGGKPTQEMYQKALKHAAMRQNLGKSVWAEEGEIYPTPSGYIPVR